MGHIHRDTIVSAIKDAIVNGKFNIDYHLSADYTLNISGGAYKSAITLTKNNGDLIEVFDVCHYTDRMSWLFNKGEAIINIADRVYEKCKN